MLVEGVILAAHGIRLSLPPFPFYADVAASFLGGGGIMYFSRQGFERGYDDANPILSGKA